MTKAQSLAFLEERLQAIENMPQEEFDERVRESGIRDLLNTALSMSAKEEEIDALSDGEMVMDMPYLGSYQGWQNGPIAELVAQSPALLSDSLLVPASRPNSLSGTPSLSAYTSLWAITSTPIWTISLALPPTTSLGSFQLPKPSYMKLGECHVNGEKCEDGKAANSNGTLALAA